MNQPCCCAIVESNVDLLRQRAEMGALHYGVPLSGANLTVIQALRHAREELLDAANYFAAAIDAIEKAEALSNASLLQ